MSTVEFKEACAAHRKCCPYKATGMTKCGANVEVTADGKCPKDTDCHYMRVFKETLRKLQDRSHNNTQG